MKKKLISLVAAICAAAALFSLSGCVADERPTQSDGIENGYSICYAFTATSDVTDIGDTTTVKDYLDALQEDDKISFTGSDGGYGFFIDTVLGVGGVTVESTDNFYSGYSWFIYTTLTTVDDVLYSSDDSVFEYNGITLYLASYGVSGLPCIEGETYALVYQFTSMSF